MNKIFQTASTVLPCPSRGFSSVSVSLLVVVVWSNNLPVANSVAEKKDFISSEDIAFSLVVGEANFILAEDLVSPLFSCKELFVSAADLTFSMVAWEVDFFVRALSISHLVACEELFISAEDLIFAMIAGEETFGVRDRDRFGF